MTSTNSFDGIAITSTGAVVTEDKYLEEIKTKISSQLKERNKTDFIPSQGKGKYEAFNEMPINFEYIIQRSAVFGLMEMIEEEMNLLQELISHLSNPNMLLDKFIKYITLHQKLVIPEVCKYLNINKDDCVDLMEQAIEQEVIEVTPFGEYIILKKYQESMFDIYTDDLNRLMEMYHMPQVSKEDQKSKCNLMMQHLNKSRSNEDQLEPNCSEIRERSKFKLVLRKQENEQYGKIFSDEKHGNIHLANFLYIPYEEKYDSEKKEPYRGRSHNVYQPIDWNIHQGRLKIIGWGPDNVAFKEGRKFGVFPTSNMTRVIPQIHKYIKMNWDAPVAKLKENEYLKFESITCHYEKDGITYIHAPGSAYSAVYEKGERRGLAGVKFVKADYTIKDYKYNKVKKFSKDLLLTDWIADNPNLPHNKWQEIATNHVLSQIQ